MLERLVSVMARLRDPARGCEWDRVQTFATIAPYTIEEAYEVADAIAEDDMAALRDELGDLQLQVVFHAAIAEDRGAFTLADVIDGICDKMERRHPHIFGEAESFAGWETMKAAERAGRTDGSALAGIARALPALSRAEKIQKRAARTGFDWPDATGPRAKVIEEMAELDAAADQAARVDEIGDLLFAVVNWARHLGIDPEAALRQANAKFERRFRAIETAPDFAGLPLDDKERLWREAKIADQARAT
ncbi:nucleoside triphosphate pyrophosphohydrolase [Sphingomonas profundi]|uniref:nucleoside triphosphate pyrophosphohydrolase n=1 Tax=Alterirhizorhabdus profundi TaxID=2681549 RepID=UPI0012E8CBE7|nr:nucleoside triphosphate pyrophosphohydrolase [Sphingomonas profundi]